LLLKLEQILDESSPTDLASRSNVLAADYLDPGPVNEGRDSSKIIDGVALNPYQPTFEFEDS